MKRKQIIKVLGKVGANVYIPYDVKESIATELLTLQGEEKDRILCRRVNKDCIQGDDNELYYTSKDSPNPEQSEPTKEAKDILHKYINPQLNNMANIMTEERMLLAMEEYASQQKQPRLTDEMIEKWASLEHQGELTKREHQAFIYGLIKGAKSMQDNSITKWARDFYENNKEE